MRDEPEIDERLAEPAPRRHLLLESVLELVLAQETLLDEKAAERVRDVYTNMLMATGGFYLLPPGEVARGISRGQLADRSTPSEEEIKRLGGILGVDALMTGVVKEYGEVRSGTAVGNAVSVSVQMHETTTGKVVLAVPMLRTACNWASIASRCVRTYR